MTNDAITDDQLEIIFRYFDGELTDAEEQQLMQQLQQNRALQQAFDQQLMMYQFAPGPAVGQQPGEIIPEPATAFLERVSGTFENRKDVKKIVPVIKTGYRWAAAAAVITCVVAALLYYYLRPSTKTNLTAKNPGKDSLVKTTRTIPLPVDSTAIQNNPTPESNVSLQQLYAANHTLFSSGMLDVPVAALAYQDRYEQKQYKELAVANETDLAVKGQNEPAEEKYALECFRFYKALGSMEANKLSQAEQLFSELISSDSGTVQIRNAACWYLLLIYLKKDDRKNAERLADVVAGNKSNPYYKRAVAIKASLQKT